MLVQQDLIKKIKEFGLNSYEAKIWTALLSRGVSSAGELSDISNVPRSRTYDVLESLEKKGFIIMKLGKPIKYMAIHPSEVINVIKKRIKEEATRQEATMDELKNSKILEDLTTLHVQGVELVEPTDLVGVLKNRENVYDYIDSLIKNSEKTVYISTTTAGLIRKFEHMKKTFKKASDNGVQIKILAPITKDSEWIVQELKNVAEVRHIPSVTSRYVLIDNTQLVFMITDDTGTHPSYDTGVWVNTPHFSNTLKDHFENQWKKK